MRFILTILLFAWISAVRAEVINDEQSLVEAIESVRETGIEVSWSSRLVKPWMRVRQTPQANEPLDALDEALGWYGLTLEAGPRGQWLVVEGAEPVPQLVETPGDGPSMVEPGPPEAPRLDEVLIVASRYSLFDRQSVSDQFLTGDEIRVLPHIADDAFRAFHRLPGVAANDYSASFNLRGGSTEEVKVVLDGLELFEPYHMKTLYNPLSIVDPGIIANAHVLSGGFTAEYGNHMSGVIDIASKTPSGSPVHELGVSFVNSFFRSSGTFGQDNDYLVSARRGYLDLLADTVADEGEELSPRYSDLFAKVGFSLSDNTSAAAHILFASDDVTFVDSLDGERLNGESTLAYAWLSLDTEPSDRLRWRNVISAGNVDNTEYGFRSVTSIERIERSLRRDVEVNALQSDLSLRFDDKQAWMFGLRYRQLEAEYDYHLDSVRQTSFVNNGFPVLLLRDIVTATDGDELGVYGRYRFRPTDRATFEIGLRWDRQSWIEGGDDSQFSPRANGLFRLSDRTNLRLGWGYFHQPHGIHELQVVDGVTDYYPAGRAEHRVAGIRHRFDSRIDLHLDIYQKLYEDLRPRFENALDTYELAPESNFDRIRVVPSSAEARGLELTLRNRGSNKLNWWVNYTWSEAEDVIEGQSIRRSWDQEHAVTGNVSWQGERWLFSLVARYHSGWPRTPLLLDQIIDKGGTVLELDTNLSQRNLRSYDDYFRIDARISRTRKLKRGSFQYYFEIFNLFNTENQCCVPDHDLQFGTVITAQPNIEDYLPFFPSFGFVWTFGPGAD